MTDIAKIKHVIRVEISDPKEVFWCDEEAIHARDILTVLDDHDRLESELADRTRAADIYRKSDMQCRVYALKLERENKIMRDALRWYADRMNWDVVRCNDSVNCSPVDQITIAASDHEFEDTIYYGGKRARAALKEVEGK